MIAAVIHLAEWDHSPNDFRIVHEGEPQPQMPPELREWYDFRSYGLPPNAGGQRDQPYGWLDSCKRLAYYYRVWRAWMASDKGPEYAEAHPDEYKAARQLREIVYGH